MQKVIKLLSIIIPVIFLCFITGCTSIKNSNFLNSQTAASVYFHKGVYMTSSPDQKISYKDFYIFYDEKSGYTEDSEMGIGLPFSCVQTDNAVKFRFGGSEEPEEVFNVKHAENGVITGSFADGKMLVFTPVQEANPDKFDAIEYAKSKK